MSLVIGQLVLVISSTGHVVRFISAAAYNVIDLSAMVIAATSSPAGKYVWSAVTKERAIER